jgi:hypothetical protein
LGKPFGTIPKNPGMTEEFIIKTPKITEKNSIYRLYQDYLEGGVKSLHFPDTLEIGDLLGQVRKRMSMYSPWGSIEGVILIKGNHRGEILGVVPRQRGTTCSASYYYPPLHPREVWLGSFHPHHTGTLNLHTLDAIELLRGKLPMIGIVQDRQVVLYWVSKKTRRFPDDVSLQNHLMKIAERSYFSEIENRRIRDLDFPFFTLLPSMISGLGIRRYVTDRNSSEKAVLF